MFLTDKYHALLPIHSASATRASRKAALPAVTSRFDAALAARLGGLLPLPASPLAALARLADLLAATLADAVSALAAGPGDGKKDALAVAAHLDAGVALLDACNAIAARVDRLRRRRLLSRLALHLVSSSPPSPSSLSRARAALADRDGRALPALPSIPFVDPPRGARGHQLTAAARVVLAVNAVSSLAATAAATILAATSTINSTFPQVSGDVPWAESFNAAGSSIGGMPGMGMPGGVGVPGMPMMPFSPVPPTGDFYNFLQQYIAFLQQFAQQVQQQQQQQQQFAPSPSYTGSNALEPPSASGGSCSVCSGPGVTGPSGPSAPGATPFPGYSGSTSSAGSYAGPTGAGAFPGFPGFQQPPVNAFGTYGTPFSAPAPGMGLFPGAFGGGSYGGSSSGPGSASASATIGPQGGYGEAQIGDKDHPELGQRQGGPFSSSGGGSYGTFSSVSTGSSTVNGKTTGYKEAISGVNDNGKITTFVARDPPK